MWNEVWLPLSSAVWRELARFYRQRSRIIGSLATPLVFWLFLGAGLGTAFPSPATLGGGGFIEYFFPGIITLTLLFTSIFSCISIIEDRNEGFLQSVLVSPSSGWGVIGGKVVGGALLALFQGTLFLFFAPVAGFSVGPVQLLILLAVMALLAVVLSALGFFFAWKLDSVQGFHGIMNLVLMPMWLLSGAFFTVERAPVYLKPVMLLNPMTHGLSAIKTALYGQTPVGEPSLAVSILALLGFGGAFVAASIWVWRRSVA